MKPVRLMLTGTSGENGFPRKTMHRLSKLADPQLQRKLLSFGAVGLVGTAAHYVTVVACVETDVLAPVTATTLGFVVGALINYALNHRYTFRSTRSHLDTGPKFLFVAVVTGMLNTLIMHLGTAVAEQHYLVAQVASTLFVFLANFALNNAWTFRANDRK
jgi:putative flippase GtrA